ncbi:hypothetical protein ACFV2H_32865 [Streptomyces sp. NPDC059629]|uniref:hypothetical protein n=1 Tax=Streptomyces sp. NPDC059629 TaxID=3346889 RepID=UPI0036C01BFC
MSDAPSARRVVDLAPLRNNVGCALPGFDVPGGFDGFGRTYPAEDLVPMGNLIGGWPEEFGRGAPDNVECDGQRIDFAVPVQVRGLVLLGAGCGGRLIDELTVVDAATGLGTQHTFGFPDFLALFGTDGDVCAATGSTLRERGRAIDAPRPSIWSAEIRLGRPTPCSGLRLPVNPGLHLFGLWTTSETPT